MVLFKQSGHSPLPFLLYVLFRLFRLVCLEVASWVVVQHAVAMVPHVPGYVLEFLDQLDSPPASGPLEVFGSVILVLSDFQVGVDPPQNHVEGPDVVLALQGKTKLVAACWLRKGVVVHPSSE